MDENPRLPADGPQPEQERGPKYLSARGLAKLADVSIPTVMRLTGGGTLKPAVFRKDGEPLFDPDTPDVAAWLRALDRRDAYPQRSTTRSINLGGACRLGTVENLFNWTRNLVITACTKQWFSCFG